MENVFESFILSFEVCIIWTHQHNTKSLKVITYVIYQHQIKSNADFKE